MPTTAETKLLIKVGGNEKFPMPPIEIQSINSSQTDGKLAIEIINLSKVAQSINRDTKELMEYLRIELPCQILDNRLLEGTHSEATIQQLILLYIDMFVLCPNCRSPSTQYRISTTSLRLKCSSCGRKEKLMDSAHNLCQYIRNQNDNNASTIIAPVHDEDDKTKKKGKKKKKDKDKKKKHKSKHNGEKSTSDLSKRLRSSSRNNDINVHLDAICTNRSQRNGESGTNNVSSHHINNQQPRDPTVLISDNEGDDSGEHDFCENGMPIYRLDPDNPKRPLRGTCQVCKMPTSFFCLGCWKWFCLHSKQWDQYHKQNEIPRHILMQSEGKTTFFARNECFHVHHWKHVEKLLSKRGEAIYS